MSVFCTFCGSSGMVCNYCGEPECNWLKANEPKEQA